MGSSPGNSQMPAPPAGSADAAVLAGARQTPQGVPISAEGMTPFNPQYVNFLGPGMGMSTGFTPGIERDLARGYSGGAAPPPPPPAAGGGAPGGMMIPQLAAPAPGSMRGNFQQLGQQTADAVNKAGTLDAYLSGRDQLAKLRSLGGFRRGQGSGGYTGGPGAGGGYTTSGPRS